MRCATIIKLCSCVLRMCYYSYVRTYVYNICAVYRYYKCTFILSVKCLDNVHVQTQTIHAMFTNDILGEFLLILYCKYSLANLKLKVSMK